MKKLTLLYIQLFLPLIVMSQSISLSPATANNGQTLTVTVTGTNTFFTQGSPTTSVYFRFSPGFPTSTNIINDTTIQVNITVPVNTYTGDYDFYTDNGINTLHSTFHINGVTPPSLISINPTTANSGQTLNVTITGSNTHFIQASNLTAGFVFNQASGTIIVNSKTIVNDSSIQLNITVPPYIHTTDFQVSVHNNIDGIVSLNNAFHINGIPPPSIVSISPAVANNGQTLNVIVTGKNTYFSNSSGMSVSGFGNINSINIINDSSVQVNVTVPVQTYTGDYHVKVFNSIDGYITLHNSFHVTGIAPPSISLKPLSAKPGETLNVTITGTSGSFSAGSSTIVSGATVNSTNLINGSTIIANITIPSTASIGNYILTVSDAYMNGTQFSTGFYIYDNCFSHYTTTYNSSGNKFTLTLDSVTTGLGTDFWWDFGDGATSTSQTPTHTFALDSVYNVCLKIKTAAGDSCTYCHDIGKNNFGEILRSTGFSMEVLRFDGTTDIVQIGKEETVSITVYPNPANDLIVVTTNQLEALRNPILSLYNAGGQLLLQQPVKQRKTELNISSFAKGIYLIKITSEEQTQVVKFVKE